MEKRPNIVVFMLDSLRPDHLGCNGCEIALTPNIDKLAKEGINFTNAYSEFPITIPTRSALLGGFYTHTCRTWKPMTDFDLHIPEVFKKKGFKTALFGDSPMTHEVFNCHKGFEYFEHSPYGKIQFMVQGANEYAKKINIDDYFWSEEQLEADRKKGDLTLKVEQGLFLGSYANELYLQDKLGIRRAAYVSDLALDWLDSIAVNGDPFFLWVDHFEPHEPWLAGDGFLEPFKHLMDQSAGHCPMPPSKSSWLPKIVLKNLLAHVHGTNFETDIEVGRVVKKIEELGLTDDTIFIVISDHGEPYGEHGTIRKYGIPIYDELAKIPFIVKGPGLEKGRVMNTLLTTPDIAGFFLEAAGLRKQKRMESLSLFPAIEDKNSPIDAVHDMIFMGAFQVRAGCRTPRWKFIDNRGEKGGMDELYDMDADPMEKNNVIKEHPDIADALCRDVYEFGKQYSRQLAFRDHPLHPLATIKIEKIMGKNFQDLMKKKG